VESDLSTPEFAQVRALESNEPAAGRVGRRAEVRVTGKFEVSPERLFDAWLDPRIAGRWLFATASRPMTLVRIDARVGGAFRFADRNDGEHIEHAGVYIEINRPRRLAFTLSLEHHQDVITRVVAEIVPLKREAGGPHAVQVKGSRIPHHSGMGGARRPQALQVEGAHIPRSRVDCELIVAHEDVPAEYAGSIEARWTGMLFGLGVALNPESGRGYSSVLRPNGRSR
jgi:uncharacterized protein YndB with AHSA1/START domain